MGDKESAFREFDQNGVEWVKRWLEANQSRTAPSIVARRVLAAEWLAPFDREERLRNEASQAEILETAKSAKDAAWAAANAARDAAREASTANTIAALALAAAVIAIAISIVGVFLR